jgi:hypothetical protein
MYAKLLNWRKHARIKTEYHHHNRLWYTHPGGSEVYEDLISHTLARI